MNLNIIQCTNGWVITKHSYDNNGYPYPSTVSSIKPQPLAPDQFVFTNLDDLITWFKTNLVLEKLGT